MSGPLPSARGRGRARRGTGTRDHVRAGLGVPESGPRGWRCGSAGAVSSAPAGAFTQWNVSERSGPSTFIPARNSMWKWSELRRQSALGPGDPRLAGNQCRGPRWGDDAHPQAHRSPVVETWSTWSTHICTTVSVAVARTASCMFGRLPCRAASIGHAACAGRVGRCWPASGAGACAVDPRPSGKAVLQLLPMNLARKLHRR